MTMPSTSRGSCMCYFDLETEEDLIVPEKSDVVFDQPIDVEDYESLVSPSYSTPAPENEGMTSPREDEIYRLGMADAQHSDTKVMFVVCIVACALGIIIGRCL